jgi:hypothetical protein
MPLHYQLEVLPDLGTGASRRPQTHFLCVTSCAW